MVISRFPSEKSLKTTRQIPQRRLLKSSHQTGARPPAAYFENASIPVDSIMAMSRDRSLKNLNKAANPVYIKKIPRKAVTRYPSNLRTVQSQSLSTLVA